MAEDNIVQIWQMALNLFDEEADENPENPENPENLAAGGEWVRVGGWVCVYVRAWV